MTVTVSAGGVTFARAQRLSVDVAGTATLGDDFVLTDAAGHELSSPYQLTLAAGAGSVSLRVASATDAVEDDGETVILSGQSDRQVFGTTITLVDPNDPPVVSGGREFSFAENAAAAVASFTATDPEDDTIDWSPAGADAALFDVAGGVLGFRDPPDYEKPADVGGDNVYNVTVRASDSGGASADHVVVVTVTDADEAATITSDTGSFTVAYDENDTEAVAAFTATDPEGAVIRWSLGGADGAGFEISGRGVLSFVHAPDFEHPADADADNEYLVQVHARAGASAAVTEDVTVKGRQHRRDRSAGPVAAPAPGRHRAHGDADRSRRRRGGAVVDLAALDGRQPLG